MSTIDELRNELADRAGDVAHRHHTDRLAGIRRKRTAQRRTMAGGVAGVTGLALAAVVALVPGNARIVDSTPPPVNKPDKDISGPELPGAPVPVVGEKGVLFYETPGIATLNHYEVGDPGQHRLEFSFIAETDVVTYSNVCQNAPENGLRDRTPWMSSITVNGHPQSGSSCNRSAGEAPEAPSVRFGGGYEREARIWKSFGVEAGARVEVVVQLETSEGKPVTEAGTDVVLGAGFWSLTDVRSPRVNESTVVDPVVQHEGVNYRYLKSVSATGKEGISLTAPDHLEGSPVLMNWGRSGSGGRFMVDTGGRNPVSSFSDYSGSTSGGSFELISSGDTSKARVTAEDLNSPSVTLWIALYKPIR
jgi:hypothetical protein